ncbi:glycosyltransferase [Haliangium ochraceum]|uniref:Glycosyl transferase group 1 n=1 Tax=Haliangium ochraceum (strain DSM 14365 / JCM 11303 / SMP-2) TaxID=502025 RepID=D0LRG5_HALO1|nr:glycosyltransferase [Haliangium ochraceum]ACY17193.1 glycosyl transferase group 1 [Haliangium ochraceum DSM 14365]
MSARENIICFAKDWNEDPTSNHHVMMEMAKTHRVLWLNSVATRTPNLKSGRDLRKIVTKLGAFLRGPEKIHDNLWVYTPIVVPLPHSKAAQAINRHILINTLRALRLMLGMRSFQLWTFLPNVADYVGSLGEELVVYYVVDEWSMFSYIDTDKTVAAERRLLARADAVFAVCHALVDSKRAHNPETHLATHGVDQALFAQALEPATEVPADLADIPGPVIGFYGTLQDWVDLELIETLARRHPEWSIVLIGQAHVDVSRVAQLGNVHLLGRKPHADLPRYCKGFDVGIIPYVISERMKYVNPIKLREYLSAGLPVVSTAVPEVALYREHGAVADDHDAFERAVVAALASDTPEKRRARSEAMKRETWSAKVDAVRATVTRVAAAKRSRTR